MSTVRLAVLGVLVASVCSAVFAEEAAAGKGERRAKAAAGHFQAADTDGNGSLSLGEFKAMDEKRMEMMKQRLGDRYDAAKAAKRPSAEDRFATLDTDKNGAVTKEEMAAAHSKRMKHRGEAKGAVEAKAEACKKVEAAPAPEAVEVEE